MSEVERLRRDLIDAQRNEAFYRTESKNLREALEAAQASIREARPFVVMSTSITSGRDFQENVRAILTRMDAAVLR